MWTRRVVHQFDEPSGSEGSQTRVRPLYGRKRSPLSYRPLQERDEDVDEESSQVFVKEQIPQSSRNENTEDGSVRAVHGGSRYQGGHKSCCQCCQASCVQTYAQKEGVSSPFQSPIKAIVKRWWKSPQKVNQKGHTDFFPRNPSSRHPFIVHLLTASSSPFFPSNHDNDQ